METSERHMKQRSNLDLTTLETLTATTEIAMSQYESFAWNEVLAKFYKNIRDTSKLHYLREYAVPPRPSTRKIQGRYLDLLRN